MLSPKLETTEPNNKSIKIIDRYSEIRLPYEKTSNRRPSLGSKQPQK